MYSYAIIRALAVALSVVAAFFLAKGLLRLRKRSLPDVRRLIDSGAALLVAGSIAYGLSATTYPLHFAMPPGMQAMTMDRNPASLPILSALGFFFRHDAFERVTDIGRDPNDVPPATRRADPTTVHISISAKEVVSEISPGISFNYWTYDGSVPGPMMRARVGDTVDLTLSNDKTSLHNHNIDLHAVSGPGGGATLTNVMPGESKSFQWLARNPGLYVYHCATSNVSTHNSHGQYGLILIEPEEGLPAIDREFYLMQGELYTQGGIGKQGMMVFDSQGLLDGNPTYVTFNGKIERVPRMNARVGERIRMYVGNGGVNLISSFHVIGEIFDVVYPEGAMGDGSAMLKNVQTTAVLPGGSAVVEFTPDVPGKYLVVDHALARMNKGAWAVLVVE